MIDDHRIEVAYAVLVCVAWIWAFSQLRVAFRKGGAWRWTTVLWMTAKATFFTVAGSIWWFNWFDGAVLSAAIYTLAIVHVFAFVHWLRLPSEDVMPTPEPVP